MLHCVYDEYDVCSPWDMNSDSDRNQNSCFVLFFLYEQEVEIRRESQSVSYIAFDWNAPTKDLSYVNWVIYQVVKR